MKIFRRLNSDSLLSVCNKFIKDQCNGLDEINAFICPILDEKPIDVYSHSDFEFNCLSSMNRWSKSRTLRNYYDSGYLNVSFADVVDVINKPVRKAVHR